MQAANLHADRNGTGTHPQVGHPKEVHADTGIPALPSPAHSAQLWPRALRRKNHQTSVSDRVLAQEAHKQQRLQAISLERFGKAYADLEWKDKTFVVQIWWVRAVATLPCHRKLLQAY